jgi:hypothetical protein
MRASRKLWMLLSLLSLALAATPVEADPITQPTDLNPGDQYRLAFVTSTTRDATSADIADYNNFVTSVANSVLVGGVPVLQNLGTTWNVIGSTRSPSGGTTASTTWINARTNTGTTPTVGLEDGLAPGPVTGGSVGVPIYLLNDTKLADDNNDLWDGSIDTTLSIDENGNSVGSGDIRVWTGTNSIGTGYTSANQDRNLGSSHGATYYGVMQTNGQWMRVGDSFPANSYRLYGMSGILTVPEPGSFMLASIGAIVLLGIRSGRKRTKTNAS